MSRKCRGFWGAIQLRCRLGRLLALIRPQPVDGSPHFWLHQFVAPPFQRLLSKHTVHGATVNRIDLKEFPGYPVLAAPTIAVKLVQSLRKSVTVDWAVRETVRARLRVMVKTLLKRYKYPPDKQEEATETVLKQAESLSAEWVAA